MKRTKHALSIRIHSLFVVLTQRVTHLKQKSFQTTPYISPSFLSRPERKIRRNDWL